MEAMLIRERYKVTRALYMEEHYSFLEAVDILDRETPPRLLNVYEGLLASRYADVCQRMGERPECRGVFPTGGGLVAVFNRCGGLGMDHVFYRRDRWDWESRLGFAHGLMQCALGLTDLPPEAGCSLLLPENLLVDVEAGRFHFRYMLRPMDRPDPQALPALAARQVRRILRPRFASAGAELRFLERLEHASFSGMVPLYALWLEEREAIRAEYRRLEGENLCKRWCGFLFRSVQWKWKGKPG